jgi:hypothetical protein
MRCIVIGLAVSSVAQIASADSKVCVNDPLDHLGEARIQQAGTETTICWQDQCFSVSPSKPERRAAPIEPTDSPRGWEATADQVCNRRTNSCRHYGKNVAAAAASALVYDATMDGSLVAFGYGDAGPPTIWNLAKDERIAVDASKVPPGTRLIGIDAWTDRFTSHWAAPTKGARELMVLHDPKGRAITSALTADTSRLLSDQKHIVMYPFEGNRLTLIDVETGAVRGIALVGGDGDILAADRMLVVTRENKPANDVRLDWVDITTNKSLRILATKRLSICPKTP